MKTKTKISVLFTISVILIGIFIFVGANGSWDYIIPRRAIKIFAIVLTGTSIAFSTVIFQTVTNNRILTPSILGLDSLYMLIQTILVFTFGSANLVNFGGNANFVLSVGLMILFSTGLYKVLFKGDGQNIYFLLLIGIIFGTMFSSMSTFMQVLIDPNEFLIVQDRMFASFNNVNTKILILAAFCVVLVSVYFLRFVKYLDVLSLGREQAINLGINYDYVVKRILVVVAILISISTALVGPITFLGLLVANLAYEFIGGYKHKYLIWGSIFISIIALVGGQLIVERVFSFSTTLSVIINFIGGTYFIYLLMRGRK